MCRILERVFLLRAAHATDQRFSNCEVKWRGRGIDGDAKILREVKETGACLSNNNRMSVIVVWPIDLADFWAQSVFESPCHTSRTENKASHHVFD